MNLMPDAESFKKNSAENSFKNDVEKGEIPANVILSESEESAADGQREKMDSRPHPELGEGGNDKSGDNPSRLRRVSLKKEDTFGEKVFKNKEELLKTASLENNSFKNIAIVTIPEKNFLKENITQNSFKSNDNPASLKEVLKTIEDEFTTDGILPKKSSWLDNMQFEIRGFSLANYPQPRTLPQSDPIFKNMAVGAYYTLNDENAVGMEFGQEAFSQKFGGIDEDSIYFTYQQYLVLPWAGISYRYTPDFLGFKNIRPLGGITLAGTTGGPVGRAMIGAKLFPESPVSMIVGAEGAVFAYQYQDKIFTSPKFGVMYGVSVKF